MFIGIDVGHATGTGAVCGVYDEHEINVELAGKLAAVLAGQGQDVEVYDYPSLSNTADIKATIAAVNADNPDCLISLHCDCASKVVGYERDEDGNEVEVYGPNPAARGAHVCYVSKAGGKLAACIARRLCALLPGRAESTVKRGNLAILNQTRCVTALCESGFVTSDEDMAVVTGRMDEVAEAIARGVMDYYGVEWSGEAASEQLIVGK